MSAQCLCPTARVSAVAPPLGARSGGHGQGVSSGCGGDHQQSGKPVIYAERSEAHQNSHAATEWTSVPGRHSPRYNTGTSAPPSTKRALALAIERAFALPAPRDPPRTIIELLHARVPTNDVGACATTYRRIKDPAPATQQASITNPPASTTCALQGDRADECGRNHSEGLTNTLRGPSGPATANVASGQWPKPIDLIALAETEPAPPAFIVDGWLPCGYATLFAGHGGVGKSGIALHLAVCIATGLPFFDMPVQRRRVLYLSCEDRVGVLHGRLQNICRHLGIANMGELSPGLHILDLVGHDCILWERDPRTGKSRMPALRPLEESIRDTGCQVLIVDGITDTFGGNENMRSEVKQFVNALVRLVPANDGVVLLVGHVAKLTAMGEGRSEGYSGSTGWHNAVRARWYLYPEKAQDNGNGSLRLELQKSNLGRTGQCLSLAWDEDAQLFLAKMVSDGLTPEVEDEIERNDILSALRASIAAGVYVPAASTGGRTAFHVLSARPEFPAALKKGTAGKHRFWQHMESLQQSGIVKRKTHRTASRHAVEVFKCDECANG